MRFINGSDRPGPDAILRARWQRHGNFDPIIDATVDDGRREIVDLSLMRNGFVQGHHCDFTIFDQLKRAAVCGKVIGEGGALEDQRKRMSKLSAIRIPGRMKMNGGTPGIIPERVNGQGELVLDRAAGMNRGRFAKPPEADINIMNVHVENDATTFSRADQPSAGAPSRQRTRAMKRGVQRSSMAAGGEPFLRLEIMRPVAQAMADHQPTFGLPCRLEHRRAFLDRARHRFLA
jgi:hypothetical protein